MVFEVNRSNYNQKTNKIREELKKKNNFVRLLESGEYGNVNGLQNETVISKFLEKEFERMNRKSPLLDAVVENFSDQVANPFNISKLLKQYKKQLEGELVNTKHKEMDEKFDLFDTKVTTIINNFKRLSTNKQALDSILKDFDAEFIGFHKIRSESRKWVELQRINSGKLEINQKGLDFDDMEDLVKEIENENNLNFDEYLEENKSAIEKIGQQENIDKDNKSTNRDIQKIVMDRNNMIPKMLDEIDSGSQFSPPRRIESQIMDLNEEDDKKKIFVPKLKNPKSRKMRLIWLLVMILRIVLMRLMVDGMVRLRVVERF